jgi:hypothetical protein
VSANGVRIAVLGVAASKYARSERTGMNIVWFRHVRRDLHSVQNDVLLMVSTLL